MAKQQKQSERLKVSTQQMGSILGVTDRRVRQLESEGLLVKIDRDVYDLGQSVQTYIQHKNEMLNDSDELNLRKARTGLIKVRRKKLELELSHLEANTHSSDDIESAMNEMLDTFRQITLKIPEKVAPEVVNIKELEPIKLVIKNHVFDALQEMSKYSPS
ncbi:hypothetical protein ACTWQB_09390 [Piscibacillus sp. B03]|uniref:hypothetical protein n=1 Tax=Piscibacillus sp. B03 TaxID=3457430 RepID=UPI003FCCF114